MELQVTPAVLTTLLQSPVPPHLLDVREPSEHEFVSLPGSKLIPLGQLAQRIEEIAAWRAEPVVVYCHHGIRSLHAIGLLRNAGFAQLQNLAGGIDRWSIEVDSTLPRY